MLADAMHKAVHLQQNLEPYSYYRMRFLFLTFVAYSYMYICCTCPKYVGTGIWSMHLIVIPGTNVRIEDTKNVMKRHLVSCIH